MPVVQSYGGRKVDTAALAGVRKSAAETPDSMGADLAQAQGEQAQALGRLGATVTHIATEQVSRIAKEERDAADRVAVQNYDTGLSKWTNKRTLDTKDGAFMLQGEAALGLPEQLSGEFKDVASSLEAGLTPRQRAMVQPYRARAEQNLDSSTRRHVFGEIKRFESESLQATVENANESAAVNASDGRRVAEELKRGTDAITASGPRLGMTGPILEKHLNDFTTKTLTGVIDRLVASGNPADLTLARSYFEQGKKDGQITGAPALAHLEASLKISDDKLEAQTVTDEIIAAGGTLAEQQAQVRERLKGKADARDRAMQYLQQADSQKKVEKREGEEHLLDDVYARLKNNGGNLRSITPAEEQALGAHLPALMSFADRLVKGTPHKNDDAAYYDMMDQAEKYPENFMGLVLRPLMSKLDDEHYERLDRLQRSMRAGDRKGADKEVEDFRSVGSVVTSAWTLAGLPTPKEGDEDGKKRIAQFHNLLATEQRRIEADRPGGKKLEPAEMEVIANRILAKNIVRTNRGWLWNSTSDVPLVTAKPDDVPAADMTQIIESLQRKGYPATPEAALAIWLSTQARKAGR